jgi:predicted RNase H-like HicB family nuclease
MKFKVHFINCKDYWVAEANNGAISQGYTLEECKSNIIDAIRLLEEDKKIASKENEIIEEFDDEIEVVI